MAGRADAPRPLKVSEHPEVTYYIEPLKPFMCALVKWMIRLGRSINLPTDIPELTYEHQVMLARAERAAIRGTA